MTYADNKAWADALVAPLSDDQRWALQQALAEPGRFYGDGGTIHYTTSLDIGMRGEDVWEVWFRCQMLPFRQFVSDGGARPLHLPTISGIVVSK